MSGRTAISVRLQHLSAQKASRQRQHDLRTKPPTYSDPARSHLNDVIVAPISVSEARRTCEALRAQRGCQRAMRSNASVLTAGIVTFGKEAQKHVETLDRDTQNNLFREVAETIAKKLRTKLVGLVVHRDESAIHAHFYLLSVDQSGQFLSKTITKDIASELQDEAANAAVEFVPKITRGKKKIARVEDKEPISKIIHRSVQQLHNDLPIEIAQLQEAIAEQQEKIAKNQRLIEEQIRKIEEQRVEEEKGRKRIATYEKRLKDAENQLREIQDQIAEKTRILQELRRNENTLQKKVLDTAQKLDKQNIELARLDQEIQRKKKLEESILARYNPPKLASPQTVEIKTGLMKSETARVYRYEQIKEWIKEFQEWGKRELAHGFEYERKELERKREDLREKNRILKNRESIVAQKEKDLKNWESSLVQREETVRRILEKDSPSRDYN